ncbi:hypothetical protein PLEOSDRAFT_1037842 [Pleurotus ostreatus PC15]|uniref:methylated diphthine methylhydrolase n=1 Tax=Pleurotus ostreatus (strain PC15) TaxID=1137138 RepID=A0A067NRU1_PLEO1|nr:hypothetical protein PLEOSDRAFT_1037842 [Pleurotus ostreatus PC15]
MPEVDTVYPADALEFCPHPAAQDIFVCGTYKLDDASEDPAAAPSPQHRRGQCLVFAVEDAGEPKIDRPASYSGYEMVSAINRCQRRSNNPLLGVANSEGRVTLHEWESDERNLRQLADIECASSDILCLSLDWSNRRYTGTGTGSLVVSLSNGQLALLQPDDQNLAVTQLWHAHDYEPWIAAWDYWNTNLIYSGGDDLQLKCWDIREGFSKPVFLNRRFEAGVTTLQSNPHREHLLVVGSYDTSVRLYDSRKAVTPVGTADAGGGVWRVKWHPSPLRADDLLVACMHDGFKILHFDGADKAPMQIQGTVAKRFDDHQSLAYGADWSYARTTTNKTDRTLIGSCSFYDHKLCLWRG